MNEMSITFNGWGACIIAGSLLVNTIWILIKAKAFIDKVTRRV